MNQELDSNEEKKEIPMKRWGIGLLAFTVYFVALMFIVEAALHPRESLIGALIAYALGILGLVGFAIIVYKKSRVLLSFIPLLIIVFGSGYLLHLVGAPVYNPFAPVSERIFPVVDTVGNMLEQNPDFSLPSGVTYEQLKPYVPLLTLVDFVISIPLFLFGLFGITWFVQIFTTKPKLTTILAVILALVFFVTGVIIVPYTQILLGGIVGLGSNIVTGGLYVAQGAGPLTTMQNATTEDINSAVANFTIASEYFSVAANELKGLRSIGVFALTGLIPNLEAITNGFYSMALSALYLTESLGPFVNGSYYLMNGLMEAVEAFEGTSQVSMYVSDRGYESGASMTQIDDTKFENGLEKVNIGLLELNKTIEDIENALSEAQNVDIDQIIQDLQTLGVDTSGISPQLRDLDNFIDIFDGATVAIKAFVSQPTINGSQSEYTTLVHFLYGAYNLIKAGDYLGETSSFNGTVEYFDNAEGNFTAMYSEISKPDVAAIADSDTPILNDSIRFMIDMTGLTVSLAEFGRSAADIFDDLQGVLDSFDVGFENITDYTSIRTSLSTIANATDNLKTTANAVDSNVTLIYNKALNNEYGQLNDPAYQLSSQLSAFNFTRDITNANSIANSFYHLFGAMEYLKHVHGNMTLAQTQIQNLQFAEASQSFNNANDSLYTSMVEMDQAIYYMNKSIDGGMTQLETSRNALQIIRGHLDSIAQNISDITAILEGPNPELHVGEIQTKLNAIFGSLDDINTELQNVTAQ